MRDLVEAANSRFENRWLTNSKNSLTVDDYNQGAKLVETFAA